MRMLILSRNASLYSTSRLVLAAKARGHEAWVIDPLEFQIEVSRRSSALYARGEAIGGVDVVIPRIGASITSYGLAVVRQFALLQVPVLNAAHAIAVSRDKLQALQLLAARNIDVPITVCGRNPVDIQTSISLVNGCPTIVKLQQGTQGIGTMIADTEQSAHAMLETFWAMGQDIVLQEFVKESKGRDLRVIVVGGKVIAAMRRVAKRGEFRANLHRGGQATQIKVSKSMERVAIDAADAMGLEVAGVDMLEGKKGPRVLEINSSPGLEGIERTTGINVAQAIIEHAENFVRKQRRSAKRALARATPSPTR